MRHRLPCVKHGLGKLPPVDCKNYPPWTQEITTLAVTLRFRLCTHNAPVRNVKCCPIRHFEYPARIAAIDLALPSGVRAPVDRPP